MANIPIQNIYFLLCYAWDKLEEGSLVGVNAEDATGVLDLLGKVLTNGTTHLLKKGLDRGYVLMEEELRGLKGKVLLGPSVRRKLLQNAKALCAFDDLNYDILHNQVIKTTIGRLIRTKGLDKEIEKEMVRVYRRMPKIQEIDIELRHFTKIRLTRNNLFYDFLLRVCRLIHENLLPDEKTGEYIFRDFVRDEHRMSLLFEAFVRNFYRREAKGFKVYREDIRWEIEREGENDSFLPMMQTDTCLEDKRRKKKIIIETKFKREVLSGYWGGRKVHSDNLYQLFAYLRNIEAQGGINRLCDGILLYASPGEAVDFSFSLPGHRLRVKTLDLNQHWPDIHNDLLSLIDYN